MNAFKQKFCFFLQRSYAYTSHALAVWLKEKYRIRILGLHGRASHARISPVAKAYDNALLLDRDVHNRYKDETLDLEYLRRLEKEYGIPNVWPTSP